MQDFEIPIVKKTYELYKELHLLRAKISKQDRYTIFQKCENVILDLLESFLEASQIFKSEKFVVLEKASVKINFLRIFLRLMKDIKSIDLKTYARLEINVDEIGRMLGGWIKSVRD